MNGLLTLGRYWAIGERCGGTLKPLRIRAMFRAVWFPSIEDAHAFADLMKEDFPNEMFFVGTIENEAAVQLKDSSKP